MQADVAVDAVWVLNDLERSQPAVLRGRCGFAFLFFSTLAYSLCIFEVVSLLPRKGHFLVGLINVFTSVAICCSCLACVAYAFKANCETL